MARCGENGARHSEEEREKERMWAVVADGEDEEHCGGDGVGDDGGGRWCDRDPPRSLFSRLLPLATLLDDFFLSFGTRQPTGQQLKLKRLCEFFA